MKLERLNDQFQQYEKKIQKILTYQDKGNEVLHLIEADQDIRVDEEFLDRVLEYLKDNGRQTSKGIIECSSYVLNNFIVHFIRVYLVFIK